MSKFGIRLNNRNRMFLFLFLLLLHPITLYSNDNGVEHYVGERVCSQGIFQISPLQHNAFKVKCNEFTYFLTQIDNNIFHMPIYKSSLTPNEVKKLKQLTTHVVKSKNSKQNKGNVYVIRVPEDAQVSYHFLAYESYKLLKQGYTLNVVFATQHEGNFPLIGKMIYDKKETSLEAKDDLDLRNKTYQFFLELENKLWSQRNSTECSNQEYERSGQEILNTLYEKTKIKVGTSYIQSFGFIIYEDGRIVTGAIDGDSVANYFSTPVE